MRLLLYLTRKLFQLHIPFFLFPLFYLFLCFLLFLFLLCTPGDWNLCPFFSQNCPSSVRLNGDYQWTPIFQSHYRDCNRPGHCNMRICFYLSCSIVALAVCLDCCPAWRQTCPDLTSVLSTCCASMQPPFQTPQGSAFIVQVLSFSDAPTKR